jgi:Mn-dependent DtxR family transcriptional regulator
MFDEDHAFLSQKLIGNLYRIKSAAAKAYLWLLVVQEERARNTRQSFEVTDSELAAALGVSLPTVGTYRRELANQGLIKVEEKKRGKNREITIRKVKY